MVTQTFLDSAGWHMAHRDQGIPAWLLRKSRAQGSVLDLRKHTMLKTRKSRVMMAVAGRQKTAMAEASPVQ